MKKAQLLVDIGQGLFLAVGLPSINSWDNRHRPKNAKSGTFGFNFQTNNLEYWDGSVWFAAAMNES